MAARKEASDEGEVEEYHAEGILEKRVMVNARGVKVDLHLRAVWVAGAGNRVAAFRSSVAGAGGNYDIRAEGASKARAFAADLMGCRYGRPGLPMDTHMPVAQDADGLSSYFLDEHGCTSDFLVRGPSLFGLCIALSNVSVTT